MKTECVESGIGLWALSIAHVHARRRQRPALPALPPSTFTTGHIPPGSGEQTRLTMLPVAAYPAAPVLCVLASPVVYVHAVRSSHPASRATGPAAIHIVQRLGLCRRLGVAGNTRRSTARPCQLSQKSAHGCAYTARFHFYCPIDMRSSADARPLGIWGRRPPQPPRWEAALDRLDLEMQRYQAED